MKFIPKIETKNTNFTDISNFVSWRSGLKFNTTPQITEISKTLFIKEIIFLACISTKTLCVAQGPFGIVVLILSNDSIIKTIDIKTKNVVTEDCCFFDSLSKKLYIGYDNKIVIMKFTDKKDLADLSITKTLSFTLKNEEYTSLIIKQKALEYSGFWIKTNKNSLCFIETKEATGLNNLKKLWRVTTYTKRTNFDIPYNEICLCLSPHNGFLYILTNLGLYKICIISTKLSLIASIKFSTEILNGKLFFIKKHIVVSGNTDFGGTIITFNKDNFLQNTNYWCFSGEASTRIKDAIALEHYFIVAPKIITGYIEKYRIIFDKEETPYFPIDYNISSKILEADEIIVSNFITDDKHFIFIVEHKSNLVIKFISSSNFDPAASINIGPNIYKDIKIKLSGHCLYLITDKGMSIIHETKR